VKLAALFTLLLLLSTIRERPEFWVAVGVVAVVAWAMWKP
jgi:hypothetical protein